MIKVFRINVRLVISALVVVIGYLFIWGTTDALATSSSQIGFMVDSTKNVGQANISKILFIENGKATIYQVADKKLTIKKVSSMKRAKLLKLAQKQDKLYFKNLAKTTKQLGKKVAFHLLYTVDFNTEDAIKNVKIDQILTPTTYNKRTYRFSKQSTGIQYVRELTLAELRSGEDDQGYFMSAFSDALQTQLRQKVYHDPTSKKFSLTDDKLTFTDTSYVTQANLNLELAKIATQDTKIIRFLEKWLANSESVTTSFDQVFTNEIYQQLVKNVGTRQDKSSSYQIKKISSVTYNAKKYMNYKLTKGSLLICN